MNNKLIIQLIKNNIQEIQGLILHFENEENDLNAGFPLLESRLSSLNKDIEVLKSQLKPNGKAPITKLEVPEIILEKTEKPSPTVNTCKPEEGISATEDKSIDPTEQKEVPSEIKEETLPKEALVYQEETTTATLNDKLQSNQGENLQEKIKKSRLEDIQSAIGINDQFLFIRELFDNSTADYKSAINYINTQDNYDKIISHFSQCKNWDNENNTVNQFFDLIKRKFE